MNTKMKMFSNSIIKSHYVFLQSGGIGCGAKNVMNRISKYLKTLSISKRRYILKKEYIQYMKTQYILSGGVQPNPKFFYTNGEYYNLRTLKKHRTHHWFPKYGTLVYYDFNIPKKPTRIYNDNGLKILVEHYKVNGKQRIKKHYLFGESRRFIESKN